MTAEIICQWNIYISYLTSLMIVAEVIAKM